MNIFVIGLPKSGRSTLATILCSQFTDCDIIDGITSPQHFVVSFDPKRDIVVFLNRIDTDPNLYISDHINIGVSVIRDYCFWLASAEMLTKDDWLEYNFKMQGEENDFVKELGSKNRVFIIRSFKKVIEHCIRCIEQIISLREISNE